MEYQLYNDSEFLQNTSAIERILYNRGIPLNEIEHYLNTTDDDIINPLELDNMKKGVALLIKHIKQNNDILVQVDSDNDGYCSAAMLINYLFKLYPAFVTNHVYYRTHEGKQHGLFPNIVTDNIKLVILPDAGSNDFEQHKILKDKGIDILVIDHHEVDYESPDACIINNQLSKYPNKTLSGVGVVYKFCSYIDSLLKVNYANDFLDLVALGIIADVMDVRPFETKHLVSKGLKQISNPYFKKMVDKAEFKLGNEITMDGVAFYVSPFINAVARMGTQEEKLILFESMLDFKAFSLVPSTKRGAKGQMETIVEQACRMSSNVKNRQTKLRDEGLEYIENLIQKNNLLENKILLITLEDGVINKNLTGLIANILSNKYQKPTLILINKKEELYEGSARGVNGSKFTNFKDFINETNLSEYAQGHQQAFGVGIQKNNLNEFLNITNLSLADYDFSPYYKVDCIFNSNNINTSFLLDITNYKAIWNSNSIPEPLVAIENIKITKDNLFLMSRDKNPTLKIILPNGVSLIKFKSSEEEYESLYSESGCVTINIVGKAERNEWNGKVTPQVLIEDYEIVARAAYYF